MKSDEIKNLFEQFESIACEYNGIECWSARELCTLLGYSKWDNFTTVIEKAKAACNHNGEAVSDHFPDVGKMVTLGSGSVRNVENYMLTRYACYLIAQNGDPKKEEVAFAQSYFAVQTRKLELIEERINLLSRLETRDRLRASEDIKKVERRLASEEKKLNQKK